MRGDYMSQLLRNAAYERENRNVKAAYSASLAAKTLAPTGIEVVDKLIQLVADTVWHVDLVCLTPEGTRRQVHADTAWNALQEIASHDYYARPWSLTPTNDPTRAIRLDWKLPEVKQAVLLIQNSMQEGE